MRLLIAFSVLLCYTACNKKTSFTPANFKGKIMTYGNGGGFTGVVTKVYLLENGDLFRGGLSDTSYIYIGKITKEQSTQMFQNYKNLGLDKMELNNPGNRYYFVEFNQDGKSHKLQWGGAELKNNNPKMYHKLMMDIVKKIEENKQ